MSDSTLPVLFFGGTFNPPHCGHANIISYVSEHLEFKHIYIVPAFYPPHKEEADQIDFGQRMEMTRITFSPEKFSAKIEVSDLEKNLPVPSYTYRSLKYLKDLHPQSKIFVLTGMDMYQNLEKWKNFEELRSNYNFIVLKRQNIKKTTMHNGDILLDNPFWNVSSMEIRKLIKSYYKTLDKKIKDELERLLTQELLDYIIQRKLYQ